MIKVELTKNVFNQRGGLFGLKPIQFVFVGIAVVVGAVTIFRLMQYDISFNAVGWIVFLEMSIIIGLGVIRIRGMNLFSYFIIQCKKIKAVLPSTAQSTIPFKDAYEK